MLEELFEANKRYSARFSLKGLPANAAKGLALVTCMDTRIEPLAMLGLVPGDAKIIRNAGGRVSSDVIRSLVFATSFLSVTRIVVLQHTKCALTLVSDEEVAARLQSEGLEVGDQEFLTMPDPDEALEADVDSIRKSPSLPDITEVEGWRYDIDTGLVSKVVI